MLIDSHCHLNFPSLISDIQSVIERAKEADVGLFQTISTKISEANAIVKIAEEHEEVFCSVGLHPSHTLEEEMPSVEQLMKLCLHPKVIGIGETGLDYYKYGGIKEIEAQKESFSMHIKASQENGIPIIVHSRSAEEDTIDILKSQMAIKSFTGVIHCFTGTIKFALQCIELGLYISASGVITFKNAKDLHEVFRAIPIDRILLETDSPFLAPVPERGKNNEPAYLKHTAIFMGDLLNKSYEEISEITSNNFYTLFKKAITKNNI